MLASQHDGRMLVVDYQCDPKSKAIVKLKPPFEVGQTVHHGQYDSFKNKLLNNAQAQGFFNR